MKRENIESLLPPHLKEAANDEKFDSGEKSIIDKESEYIRKYLLDAINVTAEDIKDDPTINQLNERFPDKDIKVKFIGAMKDEAIDLNKPFSFFVGHLKALGD